MDEKDNRLVGGALYKEREERQRKALGVGPTTYKIHLFSLILWGR